MGTKTPADQNRLNQTLSQTWKTMIFQMLLEQGCFISHEERKSEQRLVCQLSGFQAPPGHRRPHSLGRPSSSMACGARQSVCPPSAPVIHCSRIFGSSGHSQCHYVARYKVKSSRRIEYATLREPQTEYSVTAKYADMCRGGCSNAGPGSHSLVHSVC